MNRLSWLLLLLLTFSVGLNIFQYQNVEHSGPDFSRRADKASTAPSSHALDKDFSKTQQAENPTSSTQSNQVATLIAQAEQLFNQGEYDDAISLYAELLLLDENKALALKQQWWETIKSRLEKDNLNQIWPFVQAFLNSYPFDSQFLAIKAEANVKLERIVEAIEVYQQLYADTYEQKQQEYYQARARHLANEKIAQLKAQKAWQALVDFAQYMLNQEPGFAPYTLSMAEAMIALEQMYDAQNLLEPLLSNNYYRQAAQDLLDKIDKARLVETAIKLKPVGEHYLVSGILNHNNRVNLMIDTGASLSVLTQNVFDQLQSWTYPEYLRDTLLNTAGGQVNAPVYQFERFDIDGFFVDKIQFVVMPIEGMNDFDGLLGMNFLKHFKFEIDQQNNVLILSP